MWRSLLILGGLTGAISLRGPLGEANASRRLDPFRYTPDPGLVRLASVGHRSTLANLLWLRALPDLSRPFQDQELKQRWLDNVVDVVTDLEPSFQTVYTYGAAYLEMVREDPEAAVKLLERGVEKNPDDITLRLKLALAWLEHYDDREKALDQLRLIIEDPRCDAMTAGLCSALLVDEREDLAALAWWTQFLDNENDQLREVAELYLERTKRRIYLRARNEYKELHGVDVTSSEPLGDERYMSAAVAQLVLPSASWEGGQLSFPRLDELDRSHKLRAARFWVRLFTKDEGRVPTLEDLQANAVVPPPRGWQWTLEDGEVGLERVGG